MRGCNATIMGGPARDPRPASGRLERRRDPPAFHVDYGRHIHFAPGRFVNFGAVFLDVCEIRLGARWQIGPMVQIVAADHPRAAKSRAWANCAERPVSR